MTAIIRLRVSEVDAYDDNPRTEPNSKYAEIRESMRVRGLDHRLVVTKRPGASRYMLAKGGKTRLEILQELAAEDPRFEYQDFDVVPYKSESELLVAHIVENNQRDGMSFWDTANGYWIKQTDGTLGPSKLTTYVVTNPQAYIRPVPSPNPLLVLQAPDQGASDAPQRASRRRGASAQDTGSEP